MFQHVPKTHENQTLAFLWGCSVWKESCARTAHLTASAWNDILVRITLHSTAIDINLSPTFSLRLITVNGFNLQNASVFPKFFKSINPPLQWYNFPGTLYKSTFYSISSLIYLWWTIFHGIYTVSLLRKRVLVRVTPTAISHITHIPHLSVNIIENRKGKMQQTYQVLAYWNSEGSREEIIVTLVYIHDAQIKCEHANL